MSKTKFKQRIVPHLWFNNEAKDAAEFYVSIFPESKITQTTTLPETPSGDCELVSFELWGFPFMAISAGPYFTLNPSISMMVNFDPARNANARKQIDDVWAKLSDGGKVLMPLDTYPFSERYGWIQDKYGLSWQLIYTNPEGEERPPIIPSLLFVSDTCEIAEAATEFYLSLFKNSKRGTLARYPAGMEPNKEGAIMFTEFSLEGQWFTAMDGSSKTHDFSFNEALSFVIYCENQDEIDYFWENLSAIPEAEQCGWLKDKYGLSWQILPVSMEMMTRNGTKDQIKRVTKAFLKMKKFDIASLQQAYDKD